MIKFDFINFYLNNNRVKSFKKILNFNKYSFKKCELKSEKNIIVNIISLNFYLIIINFI